MTKRLKSKHKVDRRLKVNLWGRPKSPFNKRAYPPGQHGQTKNSKPSDYGIQLQAKQKLKSYYGNLNERQFNKTWETLKGMVGLMQTDYQLEDLSYEELVKTPMEGQEHSY